MRKYRSTIIPLLLALAITGLDRIVKILTVQHVEYASRIDLIPGLLGLTHITNTGAAFGMLKGQRILFILVTLFAVGFLIYNLFRIKNGGFFWSAALGFVLGGAAGNLIDRIATGEVVDMFEFLFINFAIFNVADIFITIGCGFLVVYFLLELQRERKNLRSDMQKGEEDVKEDQD